MAFISKEIQISPLVSAIDIDPTTRRRAKCVDMPVNIQPVMRAQIIHDRVFPAALRVAPRQQWEDRKNKETTMSHSFNGYLSSTFSYRSARRTMLLLNYLTRRLQPGHLVDELRRILRVPN